MKKLSKKIILGILFTLVVIPVVSFAQVKPGEGKNANVVVTDTAKNVSDTTAKLNGHILSGTTFPAGTKASVYFRYSDLVDFPPVFCNDIFGSNMRSTNELKLDLVTIGGMSFLIDVSDLSPDTTYYYCAIASNKNNIVYGEVKKFTTGISSLEKVSVTTENATVINTNSVYLNGFYNTSIPATTWFEYRKMSNENNFLEKQDTTGKNLSDYNWSGKKGETKHVGGTSGDISYTLSGLSANTTYQFKAAIKGNSDLNTIYGNYLTFKTSEKGSSSLGEFFDSNSGASGNNSGTGSGNGNLILGQTATPPVDAVVRFHEGIEHVFVRQIMANPQLAKRYGYQEGMNLNTFAWDTADFFARIFGYVASDGKEIRVSTPDIAAYRLELKDGDLIVYEYYAGVIVNIQKMTEVLRNIYGYEYYYRK